MNIVWLTTIFDDSAVSKILLDLIPSFGILPNLKITVVSLESTSKNPSRALKKLENLIQGSKLEILHISLECKKNKIFAMIKKFNALLDTINPDLIHAQLGRAYIVSMCIKKKFTQKLKRFATFHNQAKYFNTLTYFFLKFFIKKFDLISAVSKTCLDTIIKNFKTRSIPTRVIYNPISNLAPNNSKSQTNPRGSTKNKNAPAQLIDKTRGGLTILMPGRLIRGKGQDLCLHMFPKLQTILKTHATSACLYFAGTGPLRSKLETLSKNLQIDDRVFFLGYRQDIYALLGQADLVLFPSKNEGFGLVPCEAIIAGTPVITQNDPTMKEILNNEFWLCDCDNPDIFAQRAADLLLQKVDYKSPLALSQEYIKTNYNSQTIARQYYEAYKNIILDKNL